MDGASLVVGRSYALRERVSTGAPIRRVKLVDVVGRRGKIKIRHEDEPHEGLEEYVSTRNIIVPWGEVRALLRDEKQHAALVEHLSWPDRVIRQAADTVITSSGEDVWARDNGILEGDPAAIDRLMQRAGLAPNLSELHPLAFVDRKGCAFVPFPGTEALARAFAAAEPDTVTMAIEDQEAEWKHGGYGPGDRYLHDLLREHAPAFAVARTWAGFDSEIKTLCEEINRLRNLLYSAALTLQRSGQEREGRRLERALDGK